MIIKLLVAIALVEALAEIWTESVLFERLRVWVRSKSGFLGYFFDCGYCVSVWLGVGAAYLFHCKDVFGLGWWEPLIWGFVVHRGSNIWHEVISRFMSRIPWALFLTIRGAVPVDVQLPLEETLEVNPKKEEGVDI